MGYKREVLALLVLHMQMTAAPPQMFLQAEDAALAGSLALALVEEGVDVVPTRAAATHAVVIAAEGGGYVVSCEGSEVRGERVEVGPPALMVLELRHRVRALVRDTPPAVPTEEAHKVHVVTSGEGEEDVAAAFAVALLAAGVGITAEGEAVVVTLGSRADIDAAVQALVPPPIVIAPPEEPPPPVVVVDEPDPVPSLTVSGGALGRPFAVDPWGRAALFVPLWQNVGVGAEGGGTFAPAPVPVVEGMIAVGPTIEFAVLERVRVRAGVDGGVWLHGWSWDAADAGVAFDPVVTVPASVEVGVADGVAFSVSAFAGAMARSRVHQIGSEIAWSRGALFLGITGGLSFGPSQGNSAAPGAWRGG